MIRNYAEVPAACAGLSFPKAVFPDVPDVLVSDCSDPKNMDRFRNCEEQLGTHGARRVNIRVPGDVTSLVFFPGDAPALSVFEAAPSPGAVRMLQLIVVPGECRLRLISVSGERADADFCEAGAFVRIRNGETDLELGRMVTLRRDARLQNTTLKFDGHSELSVATEYYLSRVVHHLSFAGLPAQTWVIGPAESDVSLESGVDVRHWSPVVVPALVAGATGLVVGGIAGVLSLSRTSSARENCRGNNCWDAAEQDLHAARTLSWVADAGFAVALAGAATAAVALWYPFQSGDARATGSRWIATLGVAGVGIQGSY